LGQSLDATEHQRVAAIRRQTSQLFIQNTNEFSSRNLGERVGGKALWSVGFMKTTPSRLTSHLESDPMGDPMKPAGR
jgi:hypothetical protein